MDTGTAAIVKVILSKVGAPAIMQRFITEAEWKFGTCIHDAHVYGHNGINVTMRYSFDGAEGDVSASIPDSLVTPDLLAMIATAEGGK